MCEISSTFSKQKKICNSKKIPRRLLAEYEEEQGRLERLSEKVDNLPEFNFGDVFCLSPQKYLAMYGLWVWELGYPNPSPSQVLL